MLANSQVTSPGQRQLQWRLSLLERLIFMLHVKQLRQLVQSEAFKPAPPVPARTQKMDF